MASTAAPGYFEEVNVENYVLQVGKAAKEGGAGGGAIKREKISKEDTKSQKGEEKLSL